MNPVDRRAVLRSTGAAAAAFALRRSLFAFPGSLAAAGQPSASAPQAKTRYGSISGTLEDGINVFRSIPYGADTAPVRFQAPLPPTPWTGVKVVRRVHHPCAATHDAARAARREFRAQPRIRWHAASGNRSARGAGGRRRERGLPASQRLYPRTARPSQAPGAGLFSRRRLQQRLGQQPALRRQAALSSRRRGGGHGQSPAQRIRISLSRRARSQTVSRFRQRRHARPGAGPQVGARKHCRVRRRRFQGFDLWTIGRRGQVRHADGHARRARSLSSRDDHERAAGERRFDRDRVQADRSDAGQARHHASQSRGPEDHAVAEDSGCGHRHQLRLAAGRR